MVVISLVVSIVSILLFSSIFEELAQCSHHVLFPCPGDVIYMAGSWLELKRDLKVMCPNLNLHMENYTTEAIIEELVGEYKAHAVT